MDTLITRLSHVEQLTVRPTSAVRQYTRLEDEAAKAGREIVGRRSVGWQYP